jgi:predicted ATPase/DNA-binding SARP family transcriptional activator
VTGQKHSRAALAGLLWPEMPETNARMNLRKAVIVLRRSVGEHIHVTRRSLAFNFDAPHWLDVNGFETAMAMSRELTPATVEAMKKALDLFQDDFLAQFNVRDAPPFEEWVLSQRARLREMALDGLYRLAAYYYHRGELDLSLDYTRRLLALEPWREEAHRQQMLLLVKMGQRSQALMQYESCCQILAKELGITPSAETMDLAAAIRAGNFGTGGGGMMGRGEPAPVYQSLSQSSPPPFTSLPPVHNLPTQYTPFVGREAEIGDIVQWLQDPTCRLLTLAGPVGIGKTRLAIEAAQRLVDNVTKDASFTNGVFFVPLDEVSSVKALVSAIANALNYPFPDSHDLKEQLVNFLRPKNLLLLLDNFEHLLDGAELISEILTTAPGVKALVTSCQALHIQEEWFHPVRGMAFPTDAGEWSEKALEDYCAVQLFTQSARRALPGFSLIEEAEHVVRICQLVEGMPLGIELAAAWVRALPCQVIAQELEQSLDLLTTTWQNLPPRHRSMHTVFDHSWQRLSATERDVLQKLSVFQDGFQAEVATTVAGASLPELACLIEKSLLQLTPTGSYRIPELLRQFCAGRLEAVIETSLSYIDKF